MKGEGHLPWDLLDIISKQLDFDDLFQFAGVCKSWREFHKIYWKTFTASKSPLLVQTSSWAKKAYVFFSIPDRKVYSSKMDYFWGLSYSGSSSGYLIMAGAGNLLLMNPFTRRKKEINTTSLHLQGNFEYRACQPLLAFAKGSEEFVLVVSCKHTDSLHVYQSRNSSWLTYSSKGYPWKVVDFVVLHKYIYVITNKANIGVLSLKSASIKFLKLKNTPSVMSTGLKLVSCDGQLLVVHFEPTKTLDVYKIDLSTMSYLKQENLGDLALFYGMRRKCYALSNPKRWGYDKNSVYYIDCISAECTVYSGDDGKLVKSIRPSRRARLQAHPRSRIRWLDWCFRHLHDEVDYSLV